MAPELLFALSWRMLPQAFTPDICYNICCCCRKPLLLQLMLLMLLVVVVAVAGHVHVDVVLILVVILVCEVIAMVGNALLLQHVRTKDRVPEHDENDEQPKPPFKC